MYKKSGVSNQKSLTHRLVFRPDGEGVVRMNAASADSNLYSVACGTDDIYTGSTSSVQHPSPTATRSPAGV